MIDARDMLITELRQTIERQRVTIKNLQSAHRDVVRFPADWGLGRREMQILLILPTEGWLTIEAIVASLYRGFGHDEPTANGIETHISHLRRKLRPFGVSIKNSRFQGYRLIDPNGVVTSRRTQEARH